MRLVSALGKPEQFEKLPSRGLTISERCCVVCITDIIIVTYLDQNDLTKIDRAIPFHFQNT